jgi:hypothetical protein
VSFETGAVCPLPASCFTLNMPKGNDLGDMGGVESEREMGGGSRRVVCV